MNIRDAELRDLPSVKRLYAQLNPDDPEVNDGREVEALKAILESERLTILLGEIDGEVVATCYLNLIPNLTRNAAPYAVIENVVTDETLRNQGLGKAIMQHALNRAWAAGCYKVMLQTGSRRESTHNFYKACGFAADDKFAFVARPPS